MPANHSSNEIYERVTRLETEMESVKGMQAEIRSDVKAIRKSLDAATGGWRVAVLLGIPALIGAGAMKLAEFLMKP